MVKVNQPGRATPATDDLKGRIVSFMRGASTEITPSEENRLPELKSVLPAGTAVYVAHTPNASFSQVIHAALAVRRAGFLATPHIAVRRVPNSQTLRAALAELRAGGVEHILLIAGDALAFGPDEYYDLLTRGSIMERVVTDHWAAIGNTQEAGQPRVKLVVDEWGAWYGKGTSLGPEYNLSQQSTMRDALLTGITLDIFQKHADKVAVAAVAQSINCIHSLMLAQGDKFTVTPTFHVFQMYLPHRGGQAVRAEFSAGDLGHRTFMREMSETRKESTF